MQPAMYWGQRGLSCDKDTINEIIKAMRARKGVSSTGCINFFERIVSYGNRKLDWKVPSISRETSPLHHKNSCTKDSFADYLRMEAILKDFYSDLEDPIPKKADERIGQILFSAICHGALLNRRWLKPFMLSLSEGINLSGSWLWVEIKGESENSKELHAWHARNRWVADPLTHFLIMRWVDEYPEDRKNLKKTDILGAIKKCRFLQKHGKIRTIGGLLKLARARADHLIPGFLSAYAAGNLPSVCLDRFTWARVVFNKPAHYPAQSKTADLAPIDVEILRSPPEVSGDFEPEDQIKILKKLLGEEFWKSVGRGTEIVPVTTAKEAQKFLDKFLKENSGNLCQVFVLLIEWAKQLLNYKEDILEHRSKSKPLLVSSVNRYLYCIGEGLLEHACNKELFKLKKQDREMVYEKVILHKKKSYEDVFKAAGRIEQFHGFLQVFYKRMSIDLDSIKIEVGIPPTKVNAYIITPGEYKKVLELLGWGEKHLSRWQTMRIVTAILGFKTDLRQSEIVSLRLVDFQDGEEPVIQIQVQIYHPGKTFSAIRQIPLFPLLDEDELYFIRKFYAYSLREAGQIGGELLFRDLSSGFGGVTYSQLIKPIVDAMRTVTGDPRLSFHSLRHSFVTWSSVRLLLRDGCDPGTALECLNDPFFHMKNLERFRRDLLKNERQGRNFLYATATLVGHASPSTTILSYCHLMDWLLGHFLRQPMSLPTLSAKAMKEVAGISQSKASKHKKNGDDLAKILQSVSKKKNDRLTTEITFRRGRIPKINTEKKSKFLKPWENSFTDFLNIVETSSGEEENSDGTKSFPQDRSDILFAAELYQKISMLDGRVWPKVDRTLSRAKNLYDKEHTSFVIEDLSLGKEFIDVLDNLGVQKKHLSFFYIPNSERKKRSQKNDLRYWARGLGIEIEHLNQVNFYKGNTSERGNILLNFEKKLESNLGENSENKHSEALIFLMEMVEIGKLKPI
jgi:integrase